MFISSNSTLDKDLFLHNHHVTDDIFIKPQPSIYMYNNFGLLNINSTDFQYLAEVAMNMVRMGMMIEIMKSSGTLVGLMTAVGMMASSCITSLVQAMICVALIGIEVAISSGISGIRTTTKEISRNSMRLYKLKDDNTSDKYKKEFYKKSAVLIPSSLYIFDKLKDGFEPSQYMDLYKLSFDIAHFIHFEQSEGESFIMSMASIFCNLGSCSYGCYSKTGIYYEMFRLYFPTISSDINIHNVLFKYSLPYLKYGSRSPNDFLAFMNKYILLSKYSNFDVHEKLARQHKMAAHLKYKHSGDMGNELYTFDNVSYSIGNNVNIYDFMKKYISYDTIKHTILNVGLKDNNDTYDNEYISIYKTILKLGKSMISYSDFFKDLYYNLKCRAYGHPTFHVYGGDNYASFPDYTHALKLSKYSTYGQLFDGLYNTYSTLADDVQKRSLMGSWFGGNGDSIFYMTLSVMNYPSFMKRIEGGNWFMHIQNILAFYKNIDSFAGDIQSNANLLEYNHTNPIVRFPEIKAAILGSGNYDAYEDLHAYTHVANILLNHLPHLLSGRSARFDRLF